MNAHVGRAFERIALVRLSAIGDVVMALPALEALRLAHPQAHIAWVVEKRASNVLLGHPSLDEIIEFPRLRTIRKESRWGFLAAAASLLQLRRELRKRRFDVALDFQGNLKSGLCTWATGAPLRIGYPRSVCREPNWLFTNHRVDLNGQELHRMQSDLLVAAAAGAEPYHLRPKVAFSDQDRVPGDQCIQGDSAFDRHQVLLHPGTSDFMPHKRWPLNNYARLGEHLYRTKNVRLLLSWGPGEQSMVADLASELSSLGVPSEVIPDTPSMKSLGYLMSKCHLVVGSDTGPVHLAVALGVPVITLLGPGDPRHYHPFGHPDRAFYRRVACSPCRHRTCAPRDCMSGIEPHTVAEKAVQILESITLRSPGS